MYIYTCIYIRVYICEGYCSCPVCMYVCVYVCVYVQLWISRQWPSVKEWYDLAQERSIWRAMCKEGLVLLAETERYGVGVASLSGSNRTGIYPCPCGRSFRRKGDRARHSRFCEKANMDTS